MTIFLGKVLNLCYLVLVSLSLLEGENIFYFKVDISFIYVYQPPVLDNSLWSHEQWACHTTILTLE